MRQPIRLYLLYVVKVQIQFGRLRWNAARNLLQIGARTSHHSSRAGAHRRTVVLAQTPLIVLVRALELVLRQLAQQDVLDAIGARAAWR